MFDNLGKNIETFNITTKNGMNDHDSVDHIVAQFFERCEAYLQKVDGRSVCVIYIEMVLFAQKGKGTARAEAVGVLKWNLRQDGHRIWGVAPNAVNSFLAARLGFKYPNRKSKDIKAATIDALHRYCNFYTMNDNEADAYAIGLYGVAHTFEKQRLSPTALSRVI